jgi:DNA-binding transcriptional ArsR family regulator
MRHKRSASPGWKGAAPLFAALGDETRLALVARLSEGGPRSITRLTAGSAVTRQAITKHLHVLASTGLVRDVRRGRERIWQLEPDRLDVARHFLIEISRRWDARLTRLRQLVEDPPKNPIR